ncbi:uncharacterized protein LOC130935065 [Arachis stenosperma]|uniref:uncharacterized protein LOC130935065 n=1 Tax=Arachis stenosperma TaxID=217475 RepID=UPI0025ACB286|nr:uncharacterized protein LOC130935065 [Arachis stenosperma]
MVTEGPAIEALGSLFKITQVFLWDDGSPGSLPLEGSKSAEVHGNGNDNDNENDSSNLVPDWSDLLEPEDLELNKQMSELGLPLSFHTTKEKSGPGKSKKKGSRSKLRRTCHTAEEVVSAAEFHDKASSSVSCISMLGQIESSYCSVVEIDMTRCASVEGDNSACCTAEKHDEDIIEAATNETPDSDSLINNTCVDLKIPPALATGVSAGSHLTSPIANYCGIKHDESLIDVECLEISPIVSKEMTESETICNDDDAGTWHPPTNESESVTMSMEGTGCGQINMSNYLGELGDWMVFWDTFYMRKYFYNTTTQTSTWDPPPGIEHLAIVESIELDDGRALKEAEECKTQNNTKAPHETLIEEESEGKQHDEYSTSIEVGGKLVSDLTTHSEDQLVDHSDEYLERSSCNGGVSCSSVSNAMEHTISSNEGNIQAASEVNYKHLENMVIDTPEYTEFDPSTSKEGNKAKRRHRQRRKSYSETEVQFQEMPEEYPAAIGKYWWQRYILFSRFDDGVKMDEEGWFSVTPEPIARHQAERCASGIIIDCFVGVGGNAIQFVKSCNHVIAIDIDPLKIDYARHNAAIYGVDDQINFIIGDFFVLAPKLKADTVFLSPPWGGPDYLKVATYDMKTMLKPHDGFTLFNLAKEIASKVVMFLPRNVDFNQLAELSLSTSPPWSLEVEKVHLNGKLKAITAYFSDTRVGGCSMNKHIRFCSSSSDEESGSLQ